MFLNVFVIKNKVFEVTERINLASIKVSLLFIYYLLKNHITGKKPNKSVANQ